MPETQSIDLTELEAAYEIIGELGGQSVGRRLMGRRKEDGIDVLISVVSPPQGDEGNALNHLAADTQLLAGEGHPTVAPVIEGRWLGDAFAVVTRRLSAPTLEELLVRRDEEFPFVRIAAILRDLNAALVWARDRRVVHRVLEPDAIYIERGSDRPVVSFGVRPLGLRGMPGAEEDARTIGMLARVMFTRGARSSERLDAPLAEVRPGLPASIVAQTEALIEAGAAGELADVTGYIASIAMADALKAAEVHLEKTRHTMEDQRQQHVTQIESERKEHAAALAREIEAHQRDKEALQREREAHARDCEALQLEREAHARDREALSAERKNHDAGINQVLAQRARRRTRASATWLKSAWIRRPQFSRRLAVPAAVALLVVVMALAATAVARNRSDPRRDVAQRPTPIADSAAGVVATPPPPQSQAPASDFPAATTAAPTDSNAPASAGGVPADLVSGVASRIGESPLRWRGPAWLSASQAPPPPIAPRPERRLDTIFTAPVIPPRDTFPRRDTLLRSDSLVPRRDTLRKGG